MKVVTGYPPNFAQIDEVFNVRERSGVIYCYGSTIFVPDGGDVPPELLAHEHVHYVRQTDTVTLIEAWWAKYLVDPEFRLAEELPAHRAEYRKVCDTVKDRNARNRALHAIAGKLAGPLYLGIISHSKARAFIAGCR